MTAHQGSQRGSAQQGSAERGSALEVHDVHAAHGRAEVLHGVDLVVRTGERLALLGSSGSGKTTLLRIVAGFTRPVRGTVAVGGVEVCAPGRWVPAERRGVGYVPQEGALFPHLDVTANVCFGLPRGQRRDPRRAAELLELVGLDPDHARRRPHELSGGQQQRVALARALAPRPRLVLLDEPFSSLDAGLRAETRSAVAAALAASGAAAVLVTHDQSEALSFADRVAVLHEGSLVQTATPQVLYGAPVDAATARFVGDGVLLPATAVGSRAVSALGSLDLLTPAADEVLVVLRPEDVRLSPSPAPGSTPGVVTAVDYFGHESLVAVRLLEGDRTVEVRVGRGPGPAVGDPAHVVVVGPVHHVLPAG